MGEYVYDTISLQKEHFISKFDLGMTYVGNREVYGSSYSFKIIITSLGGQNLNVSAHGYSSLETLPGNPYKPFCFVNAKLCIDGNVLKNNFIQMKDGFYSSGVVVNGARYHPLGSASILLLPPTSANQKTELVFDVGYDSSQGGDTSTSALKVRIPIIKTVPSNNPVIKHALDTVLRGEKY